MKMFVWDYVNKLTCNYHDGGGIVILSESLESARVLYLKEGGSAACELLTKDPDFSCSVEDQDSRVFEFADAGCC